MPGRLGLFSDDAMLVLALAQDESIRFEHGYIGPEHLLLGILRDRPNPANAALDSLGVGLSESREALEHLIGRGPQHGQGLNAGEIPLSAEANKVIDLAPEEAKAMGSERVGLEHLFLAIVRAPGKAGAMVEGLGVSLDAIGRKVRGESDA